MIHLPLRDEIPTPLHDFDAPPAGSASVVGVSVVTSMNLKTKVEIFGGSMNLRRAGGGTTGGIRVIFVQVHFKVS